MIRSRVDRLRHLVKVLELVAVFSRPTPSPKNLRVLNDLEEFRRQQDVVDLVSLVGTAERLFAQALTTLDSMLFLAPRSANSAIDRQNYDSHQPVT